MKLFAQHGWRSAGSGSTTNTPRKRTWPPLTITRHNPHFGRLNDSAAEWFGNRRPKVLCETVTFYCCYIVVFFVLLYLVPTNVPSFLFWFVAGVSCAFVDCVRIDRWRMITKQVLNGLLFIGRNANAVNSIKTLTVAAHCVKPARKSPLFDCIV